MCQLVDSENFILLHQQVSVYFHLSSGIILSTWPYVFLVLEHYTSLESWCCNQDCWVLLGGGDWNAQTCTSAPPANFPGQHLFSGLQSLQQAARTARTAADSNSALSGDRSRDAFLLCLTVSLPTCQSRGPLYAPAASREKKRDESVDVGGQFISRTVHAGRSRGASPQQRFGRWKLPVKINAGCRQSGWWSRPSISSSDEELVRERKGASPPHSRHQIRSNLLFF